MTEVAELLIADGEGATAAPRVEILMTVYNGLPYIDEQLRSLQAQTHANWRLWIRDDGSTDRTVETVRSFAASDPRIHLLPEDGKRLGAKEGFAYLLETAPASAEYLMFSDADDVWRPGKIENTLRAMRDAESAGMHGEEKPPILVHTDLEVVGRDLELISASLWKYEHVAPQPPKLNLLLVQNSVTGCTAMINRPLRRLAGRVPPAAVMHDWWLALVACCFGQIVSLPESTILYRQHGRNDSGARPYRSDISRLPARLKGLFKRSDAVRAAIQRTADQAAAFLERFGDKLTPSQRELVADYSGIPACRPAIRKYRLLRLGTLGNGWQRRVRLVLLG